MAEQQGPGPECPVCLNPFNNTFHTPKVPDCCHSLCVECLARLRLDGDAEPGSQTEAPQAMAPTTARQSNRIPTFYALRECLQDSELPIYLMAAIFSATLLLLFFIFWAKQILWSMP